MNLPLIKLVIRLLILMILFVILYLISALIYSSKYWPDVYNYINANITIKRIPTLSELNLTVIEVDWTTEFYTTVEEDTSTVEGFDFDIDYFTNIKGEFESKQPNTSANQKKKEQSYKKIENRPKRYAKLEKFEGDYSELPTRGVVVDYKFLEDTTTIYDGEVWRMFVKDIIDESKMVPKNLGEIEMVNRKGEKLEKLTDNNEDDDAAAIFPWIATIFIKNDTASNQFQYVCDGALLTDNLLITAARCVHVSNTTVNPDDILVFLGKRTLQSVGEDERNVRISKITIHPNFTTEAGSSDLAMLQLEAPLSDADSAKIQPACLDDGEGVGKSASTSWDLTGALTPVYFEIAKNEDCNDWTEGTFCAIYGNEVALCPSYGGIFATQSNDSWCLHGIRTGDVTDKGLCFQKNILYTPLEPYRGWIEHNMNLIIQ